MLRLLLLLKLLLLNLSLCGTVGLLGGDYRSMKLLLWSSGTQLELVLMLLVLQVRMIKQWRYVMTLDGTARCHRRQ